MAARKYFARRQYLWCSLDTEGGRDDSSAGVGSDHGLPEMILCITPNPAVDRTILLPSLVVGHVHRAQRIFLAAGGKGLNVARTIKRLGGEPLCMGFAGGHNGHLLEDLTQSDGLSSKWTWTNAETRSCTILVSQDADATVINEPGMPVLDSDWKRLSQDVGRHIASANLVCLSGSLPPGSTADQLHRLLNVFLDSGKQVWVDTSGEALHTVLAHPGIHVKVNGNEIGDVLDVEVKDFESARRALTLTYRTYANHLHDHPWRTGGDHVSL